jgi:hypothetical protein
LFAEKEFRAKERGPLDDYRIFNFYNEHWSDVESKWFERTKNSSAAMSWARINGATQIAIAEELKQFGIDVFPQFAEIAMEEFLDTGAVSQAFTLPRSSAFEQEPPFAYSEPELPPF